MFTGIVEAVGTVESVRPDGEVRHIRIAVPPTFLEGVRPGASVAVDGACLTPIEVGEDGFTVDVIGTTLSRTVAGEYVEGSRVNLERAMALGARIDGHLVQGHVDGLGFLREVREAAGYHLLEFTIPREVHRRTLSQGSVSLNGVSLTVSRLLEGEGIEVGIVPHTWNHTNFQYLSPGSPVNVEGDLIGKYVGKLLRSAFPEGGDEPVSGEEEGSPHAV